MARWLMLLAIICFGLAGGAQVSAQAQDDDASKEESGRQETQESGDQAQSEKDSAQSEAPAQSGPRPVVTDEHIEVWTLMARAAANAASLPDEQCETLVEKFVELRSDFAEAEDEMRDQWREEQRMTLEAQREGEGVSGEIFDTTELEKSITMVTNKHRQRLATWLVESFERPQAEQIYPLLGSFDKKVDGLVRMIISFELEDEPSLRATEAIERFYLDMVRAQLQPVERAGAAMNSARETLLGTLRSDLDEEQIKKIARKVGARLR